MTSNTISSHKHFSTLFIIATLAATYSQLLPDMNAWSNWNKLRTYAMDGLTFALLLFIAFIPTSKHSGK